ncbi:GTP 3',8-cyclase MoaA [Stenotrophomonas oahuensis]|uniref:GTP 3',8-cyclase n=1 Tax=Stenotrophomonas oahuensis TaxID=3003271 RepID=A0ABY9YMN1_9GAMM|nr:GTP 3',8-cyclase MoaA [Stenotrophomonas sp. A5586]WNH52167.1 GTP 3',8-cyclase MoaA [Stenotrophomonas sp. A5586]
MNATTHTFDRRGRPLRDLRISVMDRCNFRCTYCMPASTYGDDYRFLDNAQRLDFNEIERVCRQAARLGVSKLRLTGGEPLLRPGLPELVQRLRTIDGIDDIALTTNGVLLNRHATALAEAGLDRVTVSVDTLDPGLFRQLSGGRGDVEKVLRGLEVARHAGFRDGVKVNAVLQRDLNDAGALDLVQHFRGTGIVLRFIEFMDVGNRNAWSADAVVSSQELHARIQARWPLQPLLPRHPGEVATRYRFVDGAGEIGLISSISKPFCGGCTRARLSSEGQLYTCLFAERGTDLRGLLRATDDDAALHAVLAGVWSARTDRYSELRGKPVAVSGRRIEMHYIGG